MITSFGDQATADLYHGLATKPAWSLPPEIRRAAARMLDMLNEAHELRDLRAPPGNRLEVLRGEWAGRHSIRINDQWRIVFRWLGSDAEDVLITDDHQG